MAGVCIDNGLVVAPCPPPDINLEDWMSSIDFIRTLDINRIYLTHFGMVEDFKTHLTHLENCLNNWAQWIKPHVEAGTDLNSIVPDFQKYVNGQLKDFGITEEGLLQYEAANPSWMSVAGLGRYWKKKLMMPN